MFNILHIKKEKQKSLNHLLEKKNSKSSFKNAASHFCFDITLFMNY